MGLLLNAFKFLPKNIRNYIKSEFAEGIEWNVSRALHPPAHSFLKDRNLRNCKFMSNRAEMLKNMPKNGVVAEIGVFKGDYSSEILDVNKPSKLYLIDSWDGLDSIKNDVVEKFKTEIFEEKVELMPKESLLALKDFPDNTFDWVYLDSDHSYDYTIKELELLNRKVKPGGIIAGDDYTLGLWYGWCCTGVIEAVNEFCLKENYEMIFFAFAPGMFNSFAIRKISELE